MPIQSKAVEYIVDSLAGWESLFTTRDGALQDLGDMRASASWRITSPLRQAVGRASRALGRAQGTPDGTALSRLEGRLRTAAQHLDPSGRAAAEPTLDGLLEACAASTAASSDVALVWLLFIAISGALPLDEEVLALRRALTRPSDRALGLRALDVCGPTAVRRNSQLRKLDIVSSEPVVFVDFVAKYGFNSGVQRVTRGLARRWRNLHPATFVAMSGEPSGLRRLAPDEEQRVFDWSFELYKEEWDYSYDPTGTVVVPWRTTLFLPEIPTYEQNLPLIALSRYSGNRVVAIGYDLIPVSSGSEVPLHEAIRCGTFLAVIRQADLVIGISETSAEEYRGYADALEAQGLSGPKVVALPLAVERVAQPGEIGARAGRPLILAVGSIEPRKNQIALVYAAEALWREGLDFELMLVGGRGPGYYQTVNDAVSALTAAGRPISLRHQISEQELAEAYAAARFSVFVSLHEGYGLPVAESLATGTPVLTTSYGSTAEIAAGGGCLVVDPRDDDAIVEQTRRLLTDDELISQLRGEITNRHDMTWDDYADRMWRLVAGEAETA